MRETAQLGHAQNHAALLSLSLVMSQLRCPHDSVTHFASIFEVNGLLVVFFLTLRGGLQIGKFIQSAPPVQVVELPVVISTVRRPFAGSSRERVRAG